MRFVVQRVSQASVEIEGQTKGQIGTGLVVFMGIHQDDRKEDCLKWVEKILKLRIFSDEEKPMNRSVQDIQGEILLISQFTLYGDTKGQNRPSFIKAAPPDRAREVYEFFVECLKEKWPKTKTGQFAAHMKVHLSNDGPVTLVL